jgi:hypothetical protein
VVADRLLECAHLGGAHTPVTSQKTLRYAIVAGERQLDALVGQRALIARMRNVNEDSSTVTRARIASRGPAMGQATKDLDPHRDDLVRWWSAYVGDEAETARIAFEGGIIEPTC